MWLHWCSFAVVELGLSEDYFWSLTLPELYLLVDRWQDRQRREDRRFGLLLAQQHNMNRKEGTSPVGPEAFFPSLTTLKEPTQSKSLTELRTQQWLAMAEAQERAKRNGQ